jgi:hypothetical protein
MNEEKKKKEKNKKTKKRTIKMFLGSFSLSLKP